jgi:hypothetical protein
MEADRFNLSDVEWRIHGIQSSDHLESTDHLQLNMEMLTAYLYYRERCRSNHMA